MAANRSWLIVCSMVALALMGSTGANHLVRRDLQRIRGGEVGDPKNASSTMYFQQLFGKAAADGSSNNGGQASVGNAPSTKNILHHHRSTNTATTTTTTTSKPPPTLMASDPSKQNHPTSIQAVNATVHGGNLTSSETVNYYGYEPTGHSSTGGGNGGINKRHVHYPPVPMDVINADDDSQNDDGDYNDDDDPDDSDDYDGDGDGDRASDSPGASDGGGGGDGGGDGEERDELEDDFDPSATFAIPSNIDPNTPGCKTVCKHSPASSTSSSFSLSSSSPSQSSSSSQSSSQSFPSSSPQQQNTPTNHHTPSSKHRANTRTSGSQHPRHSQ